MRTRIKILFRADGNTVSGLGHLYRLFSLVEIYKEEFSFIFVTRESSELDVIPESYPIKVIPNHISIKQEVSWLDEKFDSEKSLVIADGYQFNGEYQRDIKNKGFKLMYIDDLCAEHMFADIVVNHSPRIKKEDFKAEEYTRFALGTDYAMLRPLFLKQLNVGIREIHTAKSVLVCFGGSDLYDFTSKITNYLLRYNQISEINVVVGAAYIHNEIYRLQEQDKRIKILSNLSESQMIDVMKSSDIGILPTSTISYEVSVVGMLILGGYFVDNQEAIYNGFVEKKTIYGVGDFNLITEEKMISILNEVLEFSKKEFDFYLENQRKIFDGKQKERFLKLVKEL